MKQEWQYKWNMSTGKQIDVLSADHMATIRTRRTREMMEWVGPPRSIEQLLEEDGNGQLPLCRIIV